MNSLTRRHFIRWLAGLPFLTLIPIPVRESRADPPPIQKERKGSIAEFFKGEELFYEIGVWVFKRAALGRLSFKETEKKGRYVATLEGESLGFLGWVARHRVDTYRAIMEEVDGGKRLRSLSFEEHVKVGGKLRKRAHLFDYQKRRWIQLRRKKNGDTMKTEEEIPAGLVYDDFLTASYNFRYGVYGDIERGKRYVVDTFPRKGSSGYEVKVAAKREEEERRRSEKAEDGKEFFIKLLLDPEITHSKEGLVEGWLSKELDPVEGTIKDVVLFGDVKGKLVRKNKVS
jgi:hypothetical protein